MSSTRIEKRSLEAHVELCAERYAILEVKLSSLDERMTILEENVMIIRESVSAKTGGINKQIITMATTVIGVMFSAIIALLIHIVSKTPL